MKTIHFKNISIEVLDSWKESKINDNYIFIQSKKIGDSYCTLSLYHFKDPERELNEVYQTTLDKYAKLKKYKLIAQDSVVSDGINYNDRKLSFYDKKRKSTIIIQEKIMDIDGELYVISAQMHECPLLSVYKKVIPETFNSLTIHTSIVE